MKKKINLRLVEIAILAIIATMIGITSVYYGIFQKQIRTDLSISAKLLKDTLCFDTVYGNVDKIDLSTDMHELRVTWIDSDGTVLYDNDTSASNLQNHSNRPEVKDAFLHGVGESVRNSDTMNKNTFYYAVRLANGTVLRVAKDADSIWSVLYTVSPLIVCIIILIIVVCIVLSHLLTIQLIKPIETMAQNIEDTNAEAPYRELVPFANMIRKQHMDILSASKARQDFTANVSHELKTPLTAISGYAELLENGMVPKEQEEHFYHEIKNNSNRLLSLINDIIRMSELDRNENQPALSELDLYRAVEECLETLRMNANKKKISLEFSGEHCIIKGNREMIHELVENLVQNAIRYNDENGTVWVSIIVKDRPVLIVKDNGIGIPAADQSRVFERFYRVDKSRSKATGGTGLGLAIVKHIVEIHNATISLDSALGVGTTIRIEF